MTRSVSFPRSAVARLGGVLVAAALGWVLVGMAQPASAQSAPGRVWLDAGMQPVQLSDRERRHLRREPQRQLQRQPWDRYKFDRYQLERRRGAGDGSLWGAGSGELGDSPRGYRGLNGFKDYDNRGGYPSRGSGELGNPRGRPSGNGA